MIHDWKLANGRARRAGRRRGAPRRLALDADADGAARGVFDRLFGLVGEAVVVEPVNEEQSGYGERASLSTGADTKANTLEAAAHLRWVIFVSLRTAASAEAPSTPMSLCPRLQGMGGSRRVSTGADTKANILGRRLT
eukprot:scaffold32350_cov60-Phaeocystis_antarctica.AAC.5